MKKAFTLVEMMVSVSILSIMMIFLYKSYTDLNKSNSFLKIKAQDTKSNILKQKTIYLDFSLSNIDDIIISSVKSKIDMLILKTSNSIHRRHYPSVLYIVKNNNLYRVESSAKLTPPFDDLGNIDIDYFGEVDEFRVYQSDNKQSYLVNIDFKNKKDVILKIKVLNENKL